MCVSLTYKQQKRKKSYCKDFKKRKTLLTPIFGFIFLYIEVYLGWFLNRIKRHFKYSQAHSVVEMYVLVLLIIEIGVYLIVPSFMPLPLWAVIFITFFLTMRLLDISQSWVNILLVQSAGDVLYASRLLILTLINYIELILSFSIMAYGWNNIFETAIDSLSKSTIFTLGTMTAIGSQYEPISGGAWAIYVSEIGFGIFFLIIVIVRALTYFESKRKNS